MLVEFLDVKHPNAQVFVMHVIQDINYKDGKRKIFQMEMEHIIIVQVMENVLNVQLVHMEQEKQQVVHIAQKENILQLGHQLVLLVPKELMVLQRV